MFTVWKIECHCCAFNNLDSIVGRIIMSIINRMFLLRLFGASILGIAIGFTYNYVAISNTMTGYGSSKHNQPVSNLKADSEISFICVKDDDLIKVNMARSMAQNREGSWHLPGYDKCFEHYRSE